MIAGCFRSLTLAAVAAGLGLSTPAAAKSPLEHAEGKPAARQCFWSRQVNGFAAADDRTVNLRVGVKDVYQLEMFGRCPDVDWNQRLALVSRGGNYICSGLDAEIVTRTQIGPQRCPVRTIRKLSTAEIAALPKRARP